MRLSFAFAASGLIKERHVKSVEKAASVDTTI